jgi:hypothetical protein
MTEKEKVEAVAEAQVLLPKGDELVLSSSPHIHADENVQAIMLKVIIALVPAIVDSLILNKFNLFL